LLSIHALILTATNYYCYAEWRYANCHYAECRSAKIRRSTESQAAYVSLFVEEAILGENNKQQSRVSSIKLFTIVVNASLQ
jgi:hypothetical protein